MLGISAGECFCHIVFQNCYHKEFGHHEKHDMHLQISVLELRFSLFCELQQIWQAKNYLHSRQKSLQNPSQIGANSEMDYVPWELCSMEADKHSRLHTPTGIAQSTVTMEEDLNELHNEAFASPFPTFLPN